MSDNPYGPPQRVASIGEQPTITTDVDNSSALPTRTLAEDLQRAQNSAFAAADSAIVSANRIIDDVGSGINTAIAAADNATGGMISRTVDTALGVYGEINNIMAGLDGIMARLPPELRNALGFDMQGMFGGLLGEGSGDNFGYTPNYGSDTRVKLIVPPGSGIARMIQHPGLLNPLVSTSGMLFPFTPDIAMSHMANYQDITLTYNNYAYKAYTGSTVEIQQLTGTFVAGNQAEANYMLAVIHFLRTCTKMYYGRSAMAGMPPPMLFLNGHGKHMFNRVPVVVSNVSYALPGDVDYIQVLTPDGERTSVPTRMVITVMLMPMYSRNSIATDFSLEDYASGNLVSKGYL